MAGEAFRLRAGSPAITAGAPLDNPPDADYFGNAVPTTPSIGIHQPN
jgi:hypothetical protein